MDLKKTLYQLLLENANSKDAKVRKLCEKIENKLDDDEKQIDEKVMKSWIEKLESLVPDKKAEQTETTSISNGTETEVRKRPEKSENERLSEEKPHDEILENVMNTETYNKAQQILKQFDPLGLIVRDFSIDRPIPKTEFETTARQRNVPNNKNAPCTPKPVPTATQIPTCQNPTTTTPTPTPSQPLKGPITHRPILPRERSILDIVVDAIVGDGPDRRYALICQNCSGHNGMALAEEFEYLAFRCCYCGFHNPARRNRRHPQALKFPTSPDSPFNQPTPLSASYERPQYSSALNLTSVGSRSHLNRGPFERISASTENVLSSSFIESSALPPRSSKRCRTVAATQRNPASRSASACSLTTSPLLPEEESEKDPSEKSEEGES
ncbi:unnamed protein product [Hymenolepis diminuta]|uniref:Endoplasmic reticulum junction formation protein lunapark n=1 Tax=Hymenolepis diminuta TaxID=6216 RepID=A0A158QCD9_HYMDI|nr:unnamed protein product [Hymenolepis diminuta]